jgi:hypothetical protein
LKGQKGSRVIVLLFLSPRPWVGWVVNATLWPLYPRRRDQLPIVQKAVWAPKFAWNGEENLAGLRSPDPPAQSELSEQGAVRIKTQSLPFPVREQSKLRKHSVIKYTLHLLQWTVSSVVLVLFICYSSHLQWAICSSAFVPHYQSVNRFPKVCIQ